MTLTHTGADLTGITDVDGSLRTFTYSGRMTSDRWGPLTTTFTYGGFGGQLRTIDYGQGSVYTFETANSRGVSTTIIYDHTWEGVATVTDPQSRVTTLTLNRGGHALKIKTPDSALQQWELDAHGQTASYTDPLGRVTQYTYRSFAATEGGDVNAHERLVLPQIWCSCNP